MSAAAGKPSKKYAKKMSKKKTLTLGLVRKTPQKIMGCTVFRDPFAADAPRFFKVKLNDATLFCDVVNSVKGLDSTLSAPTWLNLGGSFADATGSGAAQQFPFSIQVDIASVINSGEYTQLFQQFAFLKCEVQIAQMCGDSYGGAILPTIYSVVDDNNNATFGSQQEVNQYGAAVQQHTMSAGRPCVRSCKPTPAANYFLNIVTNGYAPPQTKDPVWIDCDSTGTPHYCLKYFVRNFIAAPNSGMALRVQPTVWFACRNPR